MANTFGRLLGARLGAAVCLPAAFVSCLLGAWPGLASAAPQRSGPSPPVPIVEQIETAARRGRVRLQLRDGMAVSGRWSGYVGDWSNSAAAESSYASWRVTHGDTPRVGEMIAVVRSTGDTLRGAFEGVSGDGLAVRRGSSPSATRVSFSRIQSVIAADGGDFGGWKSLGSQLLLAPHMVAVVLEPGDTTRVLVSRSRILSASVAPIEQRNLGRKTVVVIGRVVVGGLATWAAFEVGKRMGEIIAEGLIGGALH